MPRDYSFARLAAAVLLAGAVSTTCRDSQGPREQGVPRADVTPLPSVVLVGAGNVARCDRTNDEATAALLDGIPGTVFALGDAAYPNGTATNYANCYAPTWGRQKSRTYPALGNHDYDSSATAVGYFGYFGAAAGDPTRGYYSYDLGAWHVIVLNSNDTRVPTAVGSTQEQWLKADLAATTQPCVVAMWHRPRFYSTTSSTFSPTSSVKPFWDDLYAAGADLIVNAHMRDYERFAPQNPDGAADPVNGLREIIVGTGGEGLDLPNTLIIANSEARISGVYGVLKLTLSDGSYSWQFVPVAGQTASDAGSATCHGSPVTGPVMPLVTAGYDLLTHPGDTVSLSVTFSDPGPNDAPWSYAITWGDGSSSTGTTQSQATPITARHVYSALGLDSVRVGVTNTPGITGWDTVAVQIAPSSGSVVFVGAGDIADCAKTGDSLTANLLDTIPGTVFVVGDNAYPSGSSADYTNCYDPTWGRHKTRTRPVPGNHEYSTPGATAYFGYFGAPAGDPAKGYYSYDLGDWHIIAVNSNVAHTAGSPQEAWLKADLAASAKRCTLAYMHHPLFSSGTLADPTVQPLWQDLYDAGAELVVTGHDHNYQRFAPQTPAGLADPVTGIREFVAGMGGAGLFTLGAALPNTQVQNDQTFGVLKLTLSASGYDWKFIPVAGKTFTDAGSGTCHDAPSAGNHAPTAAVGGPYSSAEGTVLAFDGSGSSDPDGDALTYAWSFGDGSNGTAVKPSHTYANNGAYTVTLTVTDTHGAASAATTTTATIANVAPAVNAGASQTVTVGTSFALNASFSDPGLNDTPWAYTIAWGDGSPQATGSATSQSSPITAAHTYTAAGTNTVAVTVTDKDGAVGSGQLTVTVTASPNRAPTAAPGGAYLGAEGTAVGFDGSGSSDPDGDALTYAWSFGDGSTGAGVKPSHSYANNAVYTVTLTVTDARGASSAPVTTTATVGNVAPTVNAGASQTGTAGSALTVSASFTDPGVNDAPWSYAYDWGDGSAQTAGSTTSQATPLTATHTYQTAATYSVRVSVTDRDGASGVGAKSVTVSTPAATATLVGAGTVASCSSSGDEATAAILDATPGTVFNLGDNVYPSGSLTNYQNCYNPSWGRHKARTAPALGNHEYDTSPTAADYFTYFGATAGDPTKGYYSYDLGAWHVVALNSDVSMSAGSAQEQWLRADLAAHSQRCSLAYWHHPRFSSGSTHGSMVGSQPLWQALYDAGAEIVLSGHEHNYERFAPQTPGGALDLARGIREFVVGTGGGSGAYPFGTPIANSEVRITGVNGVLKLTLGDGSYSWQFIPVAGQTATDAGSGTCH